MSTLIVPDTGVELHDGSVVMLARFPGTKWVVHHGWYSYNGGQQMGWYFCSIPARMVVPATDADLRLLTVVSNEGTTPGPVHPCPPPPPPHPGPVPPGPHGPNAPFSPQQSWELDRAFISVATKAERDLLNQRQELMPDGKLCRVDDVGDGKPGYFRWNQAIEQWVSEDFGVSLDGYLTEEQADAKYASTEAMKQEVAEQLEAADIEGKIETAIKDSEEVQQAVEAAVTEIANDVVPGLVRQETQQLSQDVETAVQNAELAAAKAESAQSAATTASTKAETAGLKADNAIAKADSAVSTATSAQEAAQTASELANTANTAASEASARADSATAKAEAATAKAKEADEAATAAQSAADAASSKADNAQAAATAADEKAQDALNKASAAVTTAQSAESKAEAAETLAETATETVESMTTVVERVEEASVWQIL